ncbi:hypothetical protein FOZ76_12535 [Verticiella sediminum]|uniref:PH domain-containing protein n=1 Tax=Verticiella sediminum TaxID=1247510 RepID=A0A556AMM5_9BURK|nr:hypothetical protein [Verticiella sediminum]TSH94139.1 hypothetical protein FOZ76_12535 [Verticiella sediminum]
MSVRVSEAERAALLQELDPPVVGPAYRRVVKIAAWVVLAIITLQILAAAMSASQESLGTAFGFTVVFCYVGLALLAIAMQRSVVTIDEHGLRQTWIMRREVAWEDVQYVKFIPFPLGKRLMIFHRGRFTTLQAGSQAVEIAFARIALVYRRR